MSADLAGLAAHIESLIFDERVDDARALFEEHASRLGEAPWLSEQVSAIRGYLSFHAGDVESATRLLAPVAKRRRPLGARASFYLAAIAHRAGDERDLKRHLGDAVRFGGRTFIASWAREQWADRFSDEPPPPPKKRRWFLGTAIMAAGLVGLMLVAVVTARHLKADLANARKLQRAQDALAAGKKDATEVYFVGGAGWSDQTVFLSEVHSARNAFERRYDVDGHAVVLANDPAADEDEPELTESTLRGALGMVATKMNRDDDVLFLYLTSHGSQKGLALGFASGLRATLEPRVLRTMLDDVGIRWRVVVVQGCESGVFLDALATETTVIATAASADRPSYGCADGNDFTDFGRAFIANRFAASSTFIDALESAAADLRTKDEWEHREASQPSVRVGDAIRPKLKSLGRAEGR